MNDSEKSGKESLPSNHLNESFPEASAIFSVFLSPLKSILKDSIFVLDTNVLLVPYTVNAKSLEDIKGTYAKLIKKKQLIVPAQVSREFAKNRAKKIAELFQLLSRKRNKVSALHDGGYPLLKPIPAYSDLLSIEKEIDEKAAEYRKAIDKILSHIRSWRWDDPVSTIYRELFDPTIIVESPESWTEMEIDLKRRVSNRIPPGFKDASKDDGGIGDLLIWRTILHLGQTRKSHVVFVSGDEKADWWLRSEGEALYPRFELVDEFRRISEGREFHIVKFSELLELFGVEPQVIEEVKTNEVSAPAPLNHETQSSLGKMAGDIVLDWVLSQYSPADLLSYWDGFFHFAVILNSGRRLGVLVQLGTIDFVKKSHSHRLRDIAAMASAHIGRGSIDEFMLVYVLESVRLLSEMSQILESFSSKFQNFRVIVGHLNSSREFEPIKLWNTAGI